MLKVRTRLYILGIILFIAFFLRFFAAQHGYSPNHPDEPVVHSVAYKMIKDRSLNPHRFDYPAFSMVINALAFKSFFIPLSLTKTAILQPGAFFRNLNNLGAFFESYVRRGEVDPIVRWSRYISVLWGTATVLMIYLLAREAFGDLVGLLAAFLLAINYQHLIASVLALPGVFNAFLQVAAFYLFLLLLKNPSGKRYFLSGILIGLVLATKYQVMIILPFFLIHFFISLREENIGGFLQRFFAKDFFLVLLVAPLVFFLINPYILLNFKEALRWIVWDGKRYELGVIRLRLTPLWYLYEYVLTKPLAWAAIGGIVLGLIKKQYRQNSFLFLSFLLLVFFVLLIYTHGGVYGRNFTESTPFIFIFAALLIAEFSRRKIFLAGLLTILISFLSLKNTLITSYFWAKDWNSNCISALVMRELPVGVKVGITPPVPMEVLSRKKATWVFFELKTDFTLKEAQERGIDYLLVNLNGLDGNSVNWALADNLFWEMPVEIFDNSLVGLVADQFSRYSVGYCLKPPQVPEHNFLLVKVPQEQKVVNPKLIKTYSFDENNGQYPKGWQVMAVKPDERWKIEGFSWEKDKACKKGGCLKAAVGSSYLFKQARFISEAIWVKPGKKYLVKGWVKSSKSLPADERNGFIRIDFYESSKMENAAKGIIAAVSARIFGENSWQKRLVEEIAPDKAKFMRVSLQQESSSSNFFFDEIKVYEAESTAEEKESANREEVGSVQRYPETIF